MLGGAFGQLAHAALPGIVSSRRSLCGGGGWARWWRARRSRHSPGSDDVRADRQLPDRHPAPGRVRHRGRRGAGDAGRLDLHHRRPAPGVQLSREARSSAISRWRRRSTRSPPSPATSRTRILLRLIRRTPHAAFPVVDDGVLAGTSRPGGAAGAARSRGGIAPPPRGPSRIRRRRCCRTTIWAPPCSSWPMPASRRRWCWARTESRWAS